MKRKHLLFTLLLALVVPLAALAQVERTVTVYNGNDINAHIPVDGGHGTLVPAKNQFIMDKDELSDLAGKQITKMTFHVVNSNITMKDGDHLPYSVLLAEVDYTNFGNAGLLTENLTNAYTVASGVELELTGNTLVINFSRAYTYSGNKNLLVQFSCSSATNYFTPFYESYELRFFGVNAIRAGIADLGMGIYRHFGFVPKTTFTYMDEATWANTNRPRNLQVQADSDGYRLNVSWQAPANYSGSYQALCVAHGTTPDWSNAETTSNTSTFFSQLNSNTAYDIYVRAKSALMISAPAKAIAMTKHIANLDNGNLILDFDDAYIHNGITATGDYSHRLDISRYWYTDSGYGSYHMQCPIGTVTLPSLSYQDANNGVIMEFDLTNATDLQVQFYKQGNTTTLGTFSANSWTHYTVRAIDGLGAQNTAYFQLVSSNAFDIDNIRIYKAPTTMKPYNLQASNITTNSATISWSDDNTGNDVTWYLRYRKPGATNWSTNQSAISQNEYELTGLDTYCQYEVQVMAYRNSNDYSDYTESFVFATACPATETTYNQSFTNLSDLPSYWRVAKGEGVNYSVNNNRLTVSNTSYQNTSYDYTYTSYTTLDAYVIMPYFENLQSLQLSFKAGRTAGSYNELVVGVMSDPFDVTNFSILETRVLNGPTTTYNFNLANAAYTHGYIAIKLNHYENNLQNVWFDDFVVTRFDEPTELTVSNVTNTSATLAWTSQANEFEVQYKTTSASTWTSVSPNPTTNTCTISNLTNNTEYEAQIRAKNGQNQSSPWASFGTFKTLMQETVVMGATNTSYYEDFESNDGDWMFLNSGTNKWRRFSYSKNGTDYGYGLRITNSADNVMNPSWEYSTRKSGFQGYIGTPATSYAIKTFTLTEGHYEFNYRRAVKGVADNDYMRVVLVPAETELVAGTLPDGFDYDSTPDEWFSLDYGEQLSGHPTNAYQWFGISTISLDVYPGGTYEPGNYMMVVLWHNPGAPARDGQNPPGAIDNVSVTWSSLIYPPDVNFSYEEITDTEATLNLYAPGLGIAPTSYEVQYEPALAYNNYEGAPIAAFDAIESPQSVTLTGLTPKTLYNVRLRSVYTANGHSVYSDWADYPSLFETKYPRPTELAVVDQTTSWVYVMWSPVEITLSEGQYINYWWQLTTDLNDWGDYIGQGLASYSWEQNLAPGTYYFHAKTAVYENNVGIMGESKWSEPVAFTIAPWTDPVTVFPMIQDFEAFPSRFANGLTLDGEYEHLDVLSYLASGVPTPEGGENDYMLRFHSCSNKTAYLVLPPMRPSTNDALVSFWWYHDNSDNNANEGVTVEHSSDGSSWITLGNKITRYAEETGWVKYQQVIPASGTDPVYIRLRFDGSNSNLWTRCCYLDDLTVNAFESQQPYISYVGCDANSATITLYDYAFENGYPSSAFEVQYREYRETAGAEEGWTTYPYFTNAEPYTFINHLTVTGLQPTTLYEFRACAQVSYGGFDFPWSNYCEPYRQWTDCGTYTITPNHSYTIDFEEEFYFDCWEGDIDETAWHVTTEESHGGTNSFCIDYNTTGNSQKELITPSIDLTNLYASTDNVILRFWVNYTSQSNQANLVRSSKVNVYNGSSTVYTLCNIPLNTNGWIPIELSLSKQMGNVVTVGFQTAAKSHVVWYIDDIEIIANPYPGVKILDLGGYNYSSQWNYNDHWYPTGAPTASDDVMVLEGDPTLPNASYNAQVKSIVIGQGGAISSPSVASALTVLEGVEVNCLRTNPNGNPTSAISIGANTTFSAGSVTLLTASPLSVNGTANIGTLNPGEANSVIVKDGGLLNATTINGTTMGCNDKIRIESGGQVKSGNDFYGIIEKNITGYGAENTDNPTGWNLIATPTKVMAVQTLVPQSGSEYLFDQMDIYRFSGGNTLEWDNFKCPFEDGCDSPWGTIPQGHFSAEIGLPLKGYLYALQEDATIQFVAGPVGDMPFLATNVDTDVNLTCYNTPDDASLNGWNLIGNPYTCNAYLKQDGNYIPFYKMNDTGDAIVGVAAGTPIKPCEAVFVCCTVPSSTVIFTTTEPAGLGNAPEDPMIQLPTHVLYEDQDATMTTTLTQTIELAAGTNWVSFNVDITLDQLKAALAAASPEASIKISGQNSSTTYIPRTHRWSGNLQWDLTQMYKIRVADACEISLEGMPVDPAEHPVTIVNGANYIAFPLTENMSLTDAFAGFAVNGDKILSQNSTATYNRGRWQGQGLTNLEPGKGYIYKSNVQGDRTLVFPTNAKK